MHKKLIEFNQKQRVRQMPDLQTGDVVKIHRRIFEGKKEISQVFEGVILGIKGKQSASPMLTVRKVSHGVGVELVLPLFSPIIEKIELVKRTKAKRAKLYYVRTKSAGALRMKYKEVSKLIGKQEPVVEVAAEPVEEKAEASQDQE